MASRSQSKTTANNDEIRQWAEAPGGRPAVVKSTRDKGDDTRMLRIDFPGYSGSASLEEISWEEFFEKFDGETRSGVPGNHGARAEEQFQQDRQPRDCEGRAGNRSGARKPGGRARRETGRKRSGMAAKKAPRKTLPAGKGNARKRSSAGPTFARKSTGCKAAKRGLRSRSDLTIGVA